MIVTAGTVAHARVSLSRRLMRGAYGMLAASVIPFVLAARGEHGYLLGVGLSALAAVFALTIASYGIWFARGSSAGRIEVDAESLVVVNGPRRRVVPRARILSASIVERPLGPTLLPYVEIDLTNGDRISLGVPAGDEAARALVSELGFGPGARRVRFDLAAPTRRLFHPLLGFAAYQIPSVFFSLVAAIFEISYLPLASIPITIVGYLCIRRWMRAPIVTVGDDGVLLEKGFAKRFVAQPDILAIEQLHQTAPLVIRTRSGDINLAGAAVDSQRCTAVGRALRERFPRTLGGRATGTSAAEVEPRRVAADRSAYFSRGARSVADWRAALSGMIAASYRAPSATVEDMASILTSAGATPEERVGAALALRVAGEPPLRIRVAAESVASEPLREALAAAADGDDAKLDVVLRRMSTQR